MKHLVVPTLALGVAAALLVPVSSDAYSTLGFSLPTTQRDFRVFNNFADAVANDNQTPDPNFPGHQGAVMAIWKGCIEWQSRLHGDGYGDPTQFGDLGSGGANFDPNFQGEASGPGGTNDNVFSTIGGNQLGVLAFTEMPDTGGWRIRFYDVWNWADGPGADVGANNDLQGVACRLYGTALGIGASTVFGQTMNPSSFASPNLRSIDYDDIAAIQSIYGVASPSKPRITGLTGFGNGTGVLTITGANFDATDNEVWFTQATAGGTGAPVTVTNVASSSGGTSITVSVPANAGPGDVMVKIPGVAHDTLSNAWPLDTSLCVPPFTFCYSTPNSVGPGSMISYSGSNSVAANDLILITTGNPPLAFGRYFYGMNQIAPIAFGNGARCIDPIVRLPTLTADASGVASFALDLTALAPPNTIGVGEAWAFQFWYRNPAAGFFNFNASDGLVVRFCP